MLLQRRSFRPVRQGGTLVELLSEAGMQERLVVQDGFASVDVSKLDFEHLIQQLGADRVSLALVGTLERQALT